MLSRPADSAGDILPVLSPSDLLSGSEAIAAGLRDHLNLFPGDWWERPNQGNEIFDLIALSRLTERDAPALCSALAAYIQAFPGVRSVSDIQSGFSGHRFSFSCSAQTESGETVPVTFSAA